MTDRSRKGVALVTGAGRSTGIGLEVCRQLARRRMTVVLTARVLADAEARASELQAEGLDVRGFALDVADDASVSSLASRLVDWPGSLDVLVDNAAATAAFGERPSTADLRACRDAMDTTLFGAWRTTQALLPSLRKSPHGRIVNVSSGAGSHGDRVFGLNTDDAMGGFTATFAGGEATGARPVADGAASVVWAAVLDDDGPTGGFFRDGAPLPW